MVSSLNAKGKVSRAINSACPLPRCMVVDIYRAAKIVLVCPKQVGCKSCEKFHDHGLERQRKLPLLNSEGKRESCKKRTGGKNVIYASL